MIDFNYVLMVIVFVACLYLAMTLVALAWKPKRTKQSNDYIEEIDSLNVTPEEFYKVLNFMLMYGIIDLEQYNQIQQKGLPYTG